VNLLAWSDSGEQAQFPVPKDEPYLVTGTGVAFCLTGTAELVARGQLFSTGFDLRWFKVACFDVIA
jgi:hypothetical protein